MDKKLEQILKLMSEKQYHTALELSEYIGVSEKTVRNRIKELQEILKENGAEIISKRKLGYRLEIKDKKQYSQLTEGRTAGGLHMPDNPQERVQYLIEFLLNQKEYIKLDDLCEIMYISRGTLTSDLKKAEWILQRYHLQIERRPNYGIRVQGSEFQIRVCLANTIVKWNDFHQKDEKMYGEMKWIGEILLEIFTEHEIQISEISFESLVAHIYIAGNRISQGYPIGLDKEKAKALLKKQSLEIAGVIAEKIKAEKGIVFGEEEVLYLALHLETKVYSNTRKGENIVISSKIDELVLKMLEIVYREFRIDLRDNLEIRMLLNQHMVPMDIRMQYGIPLKNPLIGQIKKEHGLAYTVALAASAALKQYYGTDVPEDEIGYLAVIFALAFEKQNETVRKKNIVIVCMSGKGSSQLFIYRYKKNFGKYIDHIYDCNVFELETFDFQEKKIDYVFTTIPIQIDVPVPVIELDLFFEQKDVEKYSQIFERGDGDFLMKYYRKELFLSGVRCKTKEEVIKKLCDCAAEQIDLPEGFYDAVLKREEMAHTDFGGLTAIPHPYKVMSPENFVAVAVLEKPIWWEFHHVQLVFLIGLSEESDDEMKKFYQTTTDFLFDEDGVRRLIREPSYEMLIRLLKDAM